VRRGFLLLIAPSRTQPVHPPTVIPVRSVSGVSDRLEPVQGRSAQLRAPTRPRGAVLRGGVDGRSHRVAGLAGARSRHRPTSERPAGTTMRSSGRRVAVAGCSRRRQRPTRHRSSPAIDSSWERPTGPSPRSILPLARKSGGPSYRARSRPRSRSPTAGSTPVTRPGCPHSQPRLGRSCGPTKPTRRWSAVRRSPTVGTWIGVDRRGTRSRNWMIRPCSRTNGCESRSSGGRTRVFTRTADGTGRCSRSQSKRATKSGRRRSVERSRPDRRSPRVGCTSPTTPGQSCAGRRHRPVVVHVRDPRRVHHLPDRARGRGDDVAGAADGYVHVTDTTVGRRKLRGWLFSRKGVELDGPIRSCPVVVGDILCVGDASGSLYGIDVDDSEPRWHVALDDAVTGTPAVAPGRLYVGCDDGQLYSLEWDADEPGFEPRSQFVVRLRRRAPFLLNPSLSCRTTSSPSLTFTSTLLLTRVYHGSGTTREYARSRSRGTSRRWTGNRGQTS